MFTTKTGSQLTCAVIFCLSVSLLIGTASAATIEIEYTGLDVTYDGSSITDTDGGGGVDDLTSAVISLDNVQQGPVLTTDLTIDLDIPGVTGLPIGGGATTSAAGGTLSLDLGAGNSIDLALEPVDVTYVDLGSGFEFAFAASVSNVTGQNLPLGLQVGSMVDMALSVRVNAGSPE